MTSLPAWLAPFAADRGVGRLVDHTLLKPEATEEEVRTLCEEAVTLGLGTVCVNGQWVAMAAAQLKGSGVRVAAVAAFPLGASGPVAKAVEARLAVADGAHEVDVVASLGWIKGGRWDLVEEEVAGIVQAAAGRRVKLILETAALTGGEIRLACEAALNAGVAMVKTSTGFHRDGGATVEAVALLRRLVGARAGVKASGGIRRPEEALRMLAAGADRIGTSSAASWIEILGPSAPTVAELVS